MMVCSRAVPAVAIARGLAFVTACAPLAAAAGELDYRAPAECPSRAEVARRLEASDAEGRAMRIEVRRLEAGFAGELVLGEGATRLLRSVDARTCAAVIEALVLVVALDRDVGATAPSSDDDATSRETTRAPDAPPDLVDPRSSSRDRSAPPVTERRAHVVITLGVAVSATSFAVGSVLPGGAVFFGVGSGTGLADVSWLKPSARLSVGRTLPTETSSAAVMPEFTLTAVSIDVCPINVRMTSRLGLVACGRAELGALTAAAAGDAASAKSQLWQGAGALARVQWVLSEGSGVRPMLELGAGILAPLQRDRFHFGPDDSAAPIIAPPILSMLTLGGGVVLP